MGCGACAYVCPENNIRLVDVPELGIRPYSDPAKCKQCGECIKVCPGVELSHKPFDNRVIPELLSSWGPILEIWEGYAADTEIRFEGSSGGAATALALFCLEEKNFGGVLHTGTKPEAPLQNVPVLSRCREELLARTGSRYSPAAPCEKLGRLQESDSSCVFIGKPCDVAALWKLRAVKPMLDDKVGLTISIFCGGTPSTEGTYNLLDMLGVKPEEAEEIRYRGRGWPGATMVKLKGNKQIRQMSYEESWGTVLSNHTQFRCRLCPDSTGEFADISCGDPWYREIEPGELGRSLLLVRTELGRRILHAAMNAGYVKLEKGSPEILAASQKALLKRRRNLFGRLLSMRTMFIPTPRFSGFSLGTNWKSLSLFDKLRSFLGTFYRIFMRGRMIPLKPFEKQGVRRLVHKSGVSPMATECGGK